MVVTNLMTFAEFIHNLRDNQKMNQREFADFCHVSQSTIVRAENFRRDPSKLELKSLRNIGDATGHSLHTLIGYIYPDQSEIDPDILALAEIFGKMSVEEREYLAASADGIIRKRLDRKQ